MFSIGCDGKTVRNIIFMGTMGMDPLVIRILLCTLIVCLRNTGAVVGEKVKATKTHGKASEPRQKFNEAQKPGRQVHGEKYGKQESSLLDSNSRSTEEDVTRPRNENKAQYPTRETLFEWYDYGYSVKELLNLVDEGSKTCGCNPMNKPILDAIKIINQALNSVSNKLRYGSVTNYVAEDSGSEE